MFFIDEILVNGFFLSFEFYFFDFVLFIGLGYVLVVLMGVLLNRWVYDMFGYVEFDCGVNFCFYGWFGFKDSCYLLSSDEKFWVNVVVSRI